MSKKSRRRNRRLLMMAALAGGAAMAGRGKGTAFPRPRAGTIDQMAANAAGTDSAVTGVIKPTAPGTGDSRFDTKFSKPREEHMSKAMRSQILQAKANAPKNVMGPFSYMQPATVPVVHPKSRSNVYKKGGKVKKAKVTGIAKRGFGRALMKGKK
jgi:hypothetical protein